MPYPYNGRDILLIPEIAGMDARRSFVRIPPELDVPMTKRVRRIVDSTPFQRLAKVAQLAFVQLVYPGARHTRFEHSLGVYRLTLLLLKRLAHDELFSSLVDARDAQTLILAALLHDLGHFPYCHLIEDLRIPNLRSHEQIANDYVTGELAQAIKEDWGVEPQDVSNLISKTLPTQAPGQSQEEFQRRLKVSKLLASILSGPIDVDKMDYLMRDSLAAGVPYGRNYDLDRLVGSVCINSAQDGIAISSKGKTAAELMVFARYVMFSEVYWHHASRAATVMFQRALILLTRTYTAQSLFEKLQNSYDYQAQTYLLELASRQDNDDASVNAKRREAYKLLYGLFGPKRRLVKRIRQFSAMEAPRLYRKLAGRSYDDLDAIAHNLADILKIDRADLILDAPPLDKEVQFDIDVYYPEEDVYRPLDQVSPVVRALAKEQFDDYVKRMRVFADPESATKLKKLKDFDDALNQAVELYDQRRSNAG
ncbi:MAG: HD domain-containing protein [Planctomycetia bacterium]|nr:HD domain-containing protein [Planctomycetia bacterium]